ncbi:MAG: hypothetical protein C0618_10950, partial [Desulfuromonas sp.]
NNVFRQDLSRCFVALAQKKWEIFVFLLECVARVLLRVSGSLCQRLKSAHIITKKNKQMNADTAERSDEHE